MFKERLKNATEIIDNPNLSGEELLQNYKEIELFNRFLGGYSILLNGVYKVYNRYALSDKHIQLMDIGSGGGDSLRAVAKKARKNSFNINFLGVDINSNSIELSEENCKQFPEIKFQQGDCFSDEILSQKQDIITANLFFHHFSDEEISEFIKKAEKKTKYAIIITDLFRNPIPYYFFSAVTFLFKHSKITKHDGKISILRGFKQRDWKKILKNAGVVSHSLKWNWAFRFQVIIYCQ